MRGHAIDAPPQTCSQERQCETRGWATAQSRRAKQVLAQTHMCLPMQTFITAHSLPGDAHAITPCKDSLHAGQPSSPMPLRHDSQLRRQLPNCFTSGRCFALHRCWRGDELANLTRREHLGHHTRLAAFQAGAALSAQSTGHVKQSKRLLEQLATREGCSAYREAGRGRLVW